VGEKETRCLYDVNVGGTMVRADGGRAKLLVFSSTAAVYGDQAQMPLTETSPLSPASLGGRSKRWSNRSWQIRAADPRCSGSAALFQLPALILGPDRRDLRVPANLIPYARWW
jgi:hypothetical protein